MVRVQWLPEHYRWSPRSGSAITSQFLGFFLDAYDLTFVTAMTPILAAVLLPTTLSKSVVGYYLTLLGYAFTMIARPVVVHYLVILPIGLVGGIR